VADWWDFGGFLGHEGADLVPVEGSGALCGAGPGPIKMMRSFFRVGGVHQTRIERWAILNPGDGRQGQEDAAGSVRYSLEISGFLTVGATRKLSSVAVRVMARM